MAAPENILSSIKIPKPIGVPNLKNSKNVFAVVNVNLLNSLTFL